MEKNNIELRKMEIIVPKLVGSNLKTMFISPIGSKDGWMVQDLSPIQNVDLFVLGVKLIYSLDGKRGEFLRYFLTKMARPYYTTGYFGQEKFCNFIALVCDIALHLNKELVNKELYHKDFPKYVANLCWNYFLDEDFKIYKRNPSEVKFNFYTINN